MSQTGISSMRIMMLLNAPYPDDIRVRKEYDALIEAGFSITLLCRRRPDEPEEEIKEGLKIVRIYAGQSNPQLALRDVHMSLTGYHKEFFRKAWEILSSTPHQFIHVHDLPLTGTAIKLRYRLNDLKVIADLHENYPEGLKVWHKWKRNPIARLKNSLFMSYKRWHKWESNFCNGSDHIIAVVDEMKERLVKDHSIPAGKITVITNTEDKSFLEQEDQPEIYKGMGSFIISYCGGIGPHRGVDTLVKSMAHLSDLDSIRLVISGFGSPSVMKHLQQITDEFKLTERVVFRGKVPFDEFYSLMKYSQINVIPHLKNGHTDHTIPHKLFQTMMAGGTLLVSSSTPLKRVVSETNAGLVFEAGNEQDLADKIRKLYSDSTLRLKLGENGLKASKEKYNWELTSENLVNMYKSLSVNG